MCSARTASSTCSLAMTHEILMGEVPIMSRLMPRSASVWNILAATPGWLRMPAPIRLILAMSASVSYSRAPSSLTISLSALSAAGMSSTGMVQEMSLWPLSLVFWMMVSTLTWASASAVKTRAATPGLSGTPRSVTLASSVV